MVIQALLKHLLPEAVVFLSQSGQEGLELARREQSDVILLDLIIPGMDGYTVCAALRAEETTCSNPGMDGQT